MSLFSKLSNTFAKKTVARSRLSRGMSDSSFPASFEGYGTHLFKGYFNYTNLINKLNIGLIILIIFVFQQQALSQPPT
jgi:hypothetical protein